MMMTEWMESSDSAEPAPKGEGKLGSSRQLQGLFVSSRDEMNLAEFPLTVLSTRTNPSVKTLEFRDHHRLKSGELVQREWIITGADKFGLPTSTDDDVVLGLICLSMREGFRARKVPFTRYELLKILRWSTEGRSYTRLQRSLDRLSGVRIRATNAFFDNSEKAYRTVNFGILDAYRLSDEGEGSFFEWSEMMFDSFSNGFIKKIDLDFYFSLRSAVSRRLYRYLDKHFYYRDSLERPLLTLAFEKLGLSRSYKYVSSVKQQLEPALDELTKLQFLAGYEFVNRGGEHLIRFYSKRTGSVDAVAEHQVSGQRVSAPEPSKRAPVDSLTDALVARGISSHQVAKLLRESAVKESAERAIEYFDHLKATGQVQGMRNLPGFLFRLIQEPERIPSNWMAAKKAAPKGVTSRLASEESPMKKGRPSLQVVRQEALREQVSPERILEFKESLTPTERDALYARVGEKLTCLKGVLTRERFAEALEGCVSDEISRMLRDFPSVSLKRAS